MSQTIAQQLTWEEAVEWLRKQPGQELLVKYCYFDDPLIDAADRYAASPEWQAVADFLPSTTGKALDLGAGRGISSYALAKMGWDVTAVEPDPSLLVGAGAIQSLSEKANLKIRIVGEYGRDFPFADASFDVVYGRQVLHHAPDLEHFVGEAFRVLKPGGTFIATREHVLTKKSDLQAFLDSHPLHKLYGGENAYLLREYTEAFGKAGFNLKQTLGSFDSVINYFPVTEEELDRQRVWILGQKLGPKLSSMLMSNANPFRFMTRRHASSLLTANDNTPGRLYSFVAVKP